MANSNTSTRRRQPRHKWDGSVGADGTRRTKVDGKQKTHEVVVDGIVAAIELPQGFTDRDTKGGRGGGIPYQEYQILITDHSNPARNSYLLVNSFLGEQAAGRTVTATIKVGLKTIRDGVREFQVYYLKLTPAEDRVPTHEIAIARNGLVIQAGLQGGAVRHALDMEPAEAAGKFLFCDAGTLNGNMEGGIFIRPLPQRR